MCAHIVSHTFLLYSVSLSFFFLFSFSFFFSNLVLSAPRGFPTPGDILFGMLTETNQIINSVIGLASFFVFVIAVWIPLTGWCPLSVLRVWSRLLRCLSGPNGRPGAKKFTFDIVAPGLLLGSLPHSNEHLLQLKEKNNVEAMVTMNSEWELPGNGKGAVNVADIVAAGIKSCWLPTPDYCAVDLKDMNTAADFIHETLSNSSGAVVYVHCNGGKGRSTIACLAYMIKYLNMDALVAYRQCKARRKIANLTMLGGIRPQWRCVQNFQQFMRTYSGLPNIVYPTNLKQDVELSTLRSKELLASFRAKEEVLDRFDFIRSISPIIYNFSFSYFHAFSWFI
jgi:protein-tyrosine phosphatase